MRIVFAREATLGMVARNTDADSSPPPGLGGAVRRFLNWWQAWLSRLPRHVAALLRPANRSVSPYGETRLASTGVLVGGVIALVVGAVGGVALSAPGSQRTAALVAGMMSVVWAAVRLLLMQFSLPVDLKNRRSVIRGAWSFGLLIWFIGVTPELRVIAWGISGALTWFALKRTGASRPQARHCVGIAWGSQALVVAGSWIARNALMVVLLSRG